jgi:hypothetical protein
MHCAGSAETLVKARDLHRVVLAGGADETDARPRLRDLGQDEVWWVNPPPPMAITRTAVDMAQAALLLPSWRRW